MEIRLKAGAGFPNRLLYTLAVIAGVSVANLYYNQPLLDMIRQEMGTSTLAANHIALFSQCGYALGLLFLIPLADLRSRRRILLVDFTLLILALIATATAPDIGVLHVSSFVIGVCSVVPQFFIPFAAQYSRPENKTATWASSFRDCSRASSPRVSSAAPSASGSAGARCTASPRA